MLPSVSSPQGHIDPAHRTTPEEPGAPAHAKAVGGASSSCGLFLPCVAISGQESRRKVYEGSCPVESLSISACFWTTGALNHGTVAPTACNPLEQEGLTLAAFLSLLQVQQHHPLGFVTHLSSLNTALFLLLGSV